MAEGADRDGQIAEAVVNELADDDLQDGGLLDGHEGLGQHVSIRIKTSAFAAGLDDDAAHR